MVRLHHGAGPAMEPPPHGQPVAARRNRGDACQGVVAAFLLLRPPSCCVLYAARYGKAPLSRSIGSAIATLAIGIPLAIATIVRYHRNMASVVAHVSLASTGQVAELYGKSDGFLPSFQFWVARFGDNFLTPLTAVVGSVTLAAGLVTVFTGSDQRARFFNGAEVVAGVQILITLAVFSLSSIVTIGICCRWSRTPCCLSRGRSHDWISSRSGTR